MANLLVTRGAGFIGGNFVHYWVKRQPDDTVPVLGNLTYAVSPGRRTSPLSMLPPVSSRRNG